MRNFRLSEVGNGALLALALIVVGCGGSGSAGGGGGGTTGAGDFTETGLVANTAGAAVTDPNLVNPWGLAYTAAGPFWVADNGAGVVTTYNGSGTNQGISVQIPSAAGGARGPVSGEVYNNTSSFLIPGAGAADFIFCSEDGVISAWEGGTIATDVANVGNGAIYKGLAIAQNGGSYFLYATNFAADLIDVFDGNFNYVTSFTDGSLPAGYAPYGIRTFGGELYVTFAKQNATKSDSQAGAGLGYVEIFTPAGAVTKKLVSNGPLNAPWGLEIAPTGFGNAAGDLLVGNFGDGTINAFNLSSGQFVGPLLNSNGSSMVIPGLWSIMVGNGAAAGSTADLYFTSGPNNETAGLFGSIAPVGASNKKRKK